MSCYLVYLGFCLFPVTLRAFSPTFGLCRGEGSSPLPLCACGAPASPSLRAWDARAGACLDTSPRGEHSPGVLQCPSALRPIHVLPCTPASPWLSHLCPIPCSVSQPGELPTAPVRAPSLWWFFTLRPLESVCHPVGVALLTAILTASLGAVLSRA